MTTRLSGGGEEILASKGDLGRLLFAATAGVGELSEGLELLRGRAKKNYHEGSRTDELSLLKQELKQLYDERQSLDTLASSYERLTETHRKAEKACHNARKARNDIRDEHFHLKVLKENILPLDSAK